MKDSKIKLPKQWMHWCSQMNLRQRGAWGKHRRKFRGLYLKGMGHEWRVGSHGKFQRGDTYEDFDRWALCNIMETPIPQTFKEFEKFVKMSVQSYPD